jgi:phosphoglycolate phosphatase
MTDKPTIFVDLDGTLLDSRRRLHSLFCELAAVEDYPLSEYWETKRRPVSNEALLIERFGKTARETAVFVQEWLFAIEHDRFLALDTLHPGVSDALSHLGKTYRPVLLTARQSEEGAVRQLRGLEIFDHFADILVTGSGRTKVATLEAVGYQPGPRDAAVGDTGEDVKVARHFGLRSFVVTNGFREASYLRQYKPDGMFESFAEFAHIV